MALIPFIIPGILSTISWILLLSPKIGLINLVIKELLGLSPRLQHLFNVGDDLGRVDSSLSPGLSHVGSFPNMDTSGGGGSDRRIEHVYDFQEGYLPLMRPAMFSVLWSYSFVSKPSKSRPWSAWLTRSRSLPPRSSCHPSIPVGFSAWQALYAVTLLRSTTGVLIYGRIRVGRNATLR